MTSRRSPARGRQAGLSLIEILVSLLVMSFGLLGMIGLQARAVQYSIGAEDTNRAALLAAELTATMQTTKTLSVASDTLTAWQTRVSAPAQGGLPSGTGSVAVSADGTVATIEISWRPPTGTTTNRYKTQVVTP